MSVMGVINMSRQFFNTLVGMGFRTHILMKGPKKPLYNFISCRTFKNVILISIVLGLFERARARCIELPRGFQKV